jgi:hypothetical protein
MGLPSTKKSRARAAKLSANVDVHVLERLRGLSHIYRLSASSIVEVALTTFFLNGDDDVLGLMLNDFGAALRRDDRTKTPSR